MKFRLDSQHYINDKLLEPGQVVGDETGNPFRFPNGDPMIPSQYMTPLDAEAVDLYRKKFGDDVKRVDPTQSIPIQGTFDATKTPGYDAKNPQNNHAPISEHVPVKVDGPFVAGTEDLKIGSPNSNTPNAPIGKPDNPGAVLAGPSTPKDRELAEGMAVSKPKEGDKGAAVLGKPADTAEAQKDNVAKPVATAPGQTEKKG